MVNLSSYPDSLVISFFVGVLLTFIKQVLEATFLKNTNPLHDNVIEFLAVAFGIGMTFGYIGIPASRPEFWNQIALGAVAGIGAIGTFHLLTRTPGSVGSNPLLDIAPGLLVQNTPPTKAPTTGVDPNLAATLTAIQHAAK